MDREVMAMNGKRLFGSKRNNIQYKGYSIKVTYSGAVVFKLKDAPSGVSYSTQVGSFDSVEEAKKAIDEGNINA